MEKLNSLSNTLSSDKFQTCFKKQFIVANILLAILLVTFVACSIKITSMYEYRLLALGYNYVSAVVGFTIFYILMLGTGVPRVPGMFCGKCVFGPFVFFLLAFFEFFWGSQCAMGTLRAPQGAPRRAKSTPRSTQEHIKSH